MDLLRIASLRDLQSEFQLDLATASSLEYQCYWNLCRMGLLAHGPPTWTYATGTTLYETDRPEVHISEQLASYCTNLEHVKACLKLPSIGAQLRERPMMWHTLDVFSLQNDSTYAKWRQAYDEDLQKSKAILDEKTDISEERPFLKCRKCKGTAIDVEQKQTRSADEPMTVFCMCRACGTRFVLH